MRCEEVQIEISTGAPLGEAKTSHLSECEECRTLAHFESHLAVQAKEWRNEAPDQSLKESIVSALAAEDRSLPFLRTRHPSRVTRHPSPVTRHIRTGLFAGAAAAAVVAMFLLSGGSNAEAAYRRMVQNVDQVSSAHYTLYWRPRQGNVSDGPMRKIYELWWKPGFWRESAAADMGGERLKIQTPNGMTFSRYDARLGKVVTMGETAPQPTRFTVQDMANVLMDKPAFFEETPIDAQSSLITVTNAGKWSRVLFYVDKATNLPFKGDKQYKDANGWETSGHFDLESNQQIDPARFDPEDLEPGRDQRTTSPAR